MIVDIVMNSFPPHRSFKTTIAQKKNTTEQAAKQFKLFEPDLQMPLVPLSSNQVQQNPEQPISESIPEVPFVIPSNSRPRKSLKIIRPNKKVSEAEQNNEPVQNPDLAQPTTFPRNFISIETTPAALKVLSCESQNPTSSSTKPHKSSQIQKNKILVKYPLLHSFRICSGYFEFLF